MATNTSHYNLIKPGTDDYYDVGDFNSNSDIIDTALYSKIGKINNPIAGNIAILTSTGDIADGGLKFSIVNGILRITYDDGE